MFIAFFLPWKLLFDVNAFHICDILLSNPNNISVDLISTGTHNDVFNIQPNTFLHKRIKIGKLWLLCKKPFLSQIDTHTRLFFIIKENEKNDRKDFVIYAKSKRSKCWSNFEHIWFEISHNTLQINEKSTSIL